MPPALSLFGAHRHRHPLPRPRAAARYERDAPAGGGVRRDAARGSDERPGHRPFGARTQGADRPARPVRQARTPRGGHRRGGQAGGHGARSSSTWRRGLPRIMRSASPTTTTPLFCFPASGASSTRCTRGRSWKSPRRPARWPAAGRASPPPPTTFCAG